jgi:hypothetical protein
MTEQISADGRLLALIVRAKDDLPTETTFPTPRELSLQLGYVVYPAGNGDPSRRPPANRPPSDRYA